MLRLKDSIFQLDVLSSGRSLADPDILRTDSEPRGFAQTFQHGMEADLSGFAETFRPGTEGDLTDDSMEIDDLTSNTLMSVHCIQFVPTGVLIAACTSLWLK